jgi:enoyl-CoA hydratase
VDQNTRHTEDSGRSPDLRVSAVGACGVIHVAVKNLDPLNIPRAADCEKLSQMLQVWSRNPDIYGVAIDFSAQPAGERLDTSSNPDDSRSFYQLLWQLNCFTKPTVSLLNTALPVWAFAVGSAGTHQVAGPDFRLSIPAPRQGSGNFYGLSQRLANVPQRGAGSYLALTGPTLQSNDALHLGLITHCLPPEEFEAVKLALRDAEPVDPLLDMRHREPAPASILADYSGSISRCFAGASYEQIEQRLQAETGAAASWATGTLENLTSVPRALTTARLDLIDRARPLDWRAALIDDFGQSPQGAAAPLELISRTALQAAAAQ